MTLEKQRIAIATACGWTEISSRCMWGLPPFAIDCGTEDCLKHLPDYLNDLNACHEMEKALTDIQRGYYWDHLKDMTDEGFDQLHATAPQRAEAFLRTLGLWEEDAQ